LENQVGRNDPCPCGSGLKYKRCCMARDKAAQAERMAWERAAQDMRVALIGFAKERDFAQDLAAGLGLFWQDRYTADTVHLMSVDESLRFFDWFAFDYGMQYLAVPEEGGHPDRGLRLVEIYRRRVADALSEKEAAVLDAWIESLPGSAFVLEESDVEQGTIVIHDMFLADRRLSVHDRAAATHGEVGQILLTRPLPERESMHLAGATVVLPGSEEQGLRECIESAYQGYVDEQGRAEESRADEPSMWPQFLRDRAYLLTHYALQWAEREGRPAVSAQDPDAPKPGRDVVGKLVRWSQARVRT
jgi:SEC-C motif